MDKKDFMAQYRSKWWIETSKRIKSRDNNTCQMCGCNDKPLSVHHLYYGEGGSIEVEDSSLVTLCEDCHKEQNEYRSDCNALIDEMRQSMTDIELYQVFNYVLNHFCPTVNMPVWMCNIDAELQIPDVYISDTYGDEVKKIHNIRKWRTNLRRKELLKEALWEYYLSIHRGNGEKEIIEKWVISNYGKTIAEYIERHKEEASEIEENVKQYLNDKQMEGKSC